MSNYYGAGVDRSVVIAIEKSWHPKDLSKEPSKGDDLPNFVYFTDFPEDSGKITQRAAKIQSNEGRSDACKVAVKSGNPTYLAGCTVADVGLENFTAVPTPSPRPQRPKVKTH